MSSFSTRLRQSRLITTGENLIAGRSGPGSVLTAKTEALLPAHERRQSEDTEEDATPKGGDKLVVPDNHWTVNPAALEVMKKMTVHSNTTKMLVLQPRLTAYHGTSVPVRIIFYLLSTEVGRLASLDSFWRRIVQHVMLWEGLYCRDYGPGCVWRTLQGQRGSQRCLFHMELTHKEDFKECCAKITAIPGRSSKELMESYVKWRNEGKAIQQMVACTPDKDAENQNAGDPVTDAVDAAATFATTGATVPALPPPKAKRFPRPKPVVNKHCGFGLGKSASEESRPRYAVPVRSLERDTVRPWRASPRPESL